MALIELLESFRHAESTLARDRFYALLGFAADSHNGAFQPNYTSSLGEVVCRIAQAFVAQGKIMLLLSRSGLAANSEHNMARFPSWIPNWTVPKSSSLWGSSSHRGVGFAASWKAKSLVNCFSSDDRVTVHGHSVDTVTLVTVAGCTSEKLGEYLSHIDDIMNKFKSAKYVVKDELKWTVPTAGTQYPQTTSDMNTKMHTLYKALWQILDFENSFNVDSRSREASGNYKRALFECLEGWRFFVTKHGYAGIGPAVTQEGDIVVVFAGYAVSFTT